MPETECLLFPQDGCFTHKLLISGMAIHPASWWEWKPWNQPGFLPFICLSDPAAIPTRSALNIHPQCDRFSPPSLPTSYLSRCRHLTWIISKYPLPPPLPSAVCSQPYSQIGTREMSDNIASLFCTSQLPSITFFSHSFLIRVKCT